MFEVGTAIGTPILSTVELENVVDVISEKLLVLQRFLE